MKDVKNKLKAIGRIACIATLMVFAVAILFIGMTNGKGLQATKAVLFLFLIACFPALLKIALETIQQKIQDYKAKQSA